VGQIRIRAEEKEFNLVLRVAFAVPAATFADPSRLRQVRTNRAGNAIRFTEPGEVTLSIDRPLPDVLAYPLEGTGISDARQPYLFEALSRAGGSTTPLYGATGLGLAIAPQLVRMMGGQLRVRSSGRMSWSWTPAKATGV
jgi:two-component system, sensor histidine kinase and response regulator